MSFDKTKAMRNAERYLAQGKIRSAIGEYEQVVRHDSKDFGTLNMLGDLYVKTSAQSQAVGCYTSVAEHYSKLGFAQKAIAIYNKISKLEPGSIEVSAKLAELYKIKGSVREARAHYIILAEHYQNVGKKVEALAIWKQIALLDPMTTDVFLDIAKSYIEEGQPDEAIEAYTECGNRFAKQNKQVEALDCFSKALDIKCDDPRALSGFVTSKFAMNAPGEAAEALAALLEKQPNNREILNLLIECYVADGDIAAAETAVIKLVEHEPANYPKFLELASIYLEKADLVSASRILSMSSEHLLVGGQANEFNALVHQILAGDPEQLDALRLLVRYCAWQKDEEGFRDGLVRLAGIAREAGFVDDERYALSQLTMILPHETDYADRLKAINEEFGFEDAGMGESLFDKRFMKENSNGNGSKAPAVPDVTEAAFSFAESAGHVADPAEFTASFDAELETFHGEVVIAATADDADHPTGLEDEQLLPSIELKLEKEIDSIRFYIESGYVELAGKAINELRGEYGDRAEINALREHWKSVSENAGEAPADEPEAGSAVTEIAATTGSFDLGELRSELGIEETESAEDADYDTHYHTAVAYQEMGLIEQAIHEYQDAVGLVSPDDGTRRFFQCANLLGHCFMQQGMPKLALKWYTRTLETQDLSEDEKQGLWYEVGAAHEMDGDVENAARFFELVYAENVDFRDVRERVKKFLVHH